jgi:hypothetical protein
MENCAGKVATLAFVGGITAFILFPGFIISIPPIDGKWFFTGRVTTVSAIVHAIFIGLVLALIYYLVLRSWGVCGQQYDGKTVMMAPGATTYQRSPTQTVCG